jgi:hypothetical protein
MTAVHVNFANESFERLSGEVYHYRNCIVSAKAISYRRDIVRKMIFSIRVFVTLLDYLKFLRSPS